ncbi:MAG: nuclear transport factor 2 family protein [Bacteroidales bacterium]
MKKYLLPLFCMIWLAGTSCETKINTEKEKKAIMEVLYKEAEAIKAGDLDGLFALHTQDSLETRIELGIYGYNTIKGWDNVKALLRDAVQGLQHPYAVNTKENVIIKVAGNSAWLTCDNIWTWNLDGDSQGYSNIQVVFFEKIKGEWKISFASYYSKAIPVGNN